MRTNIKISGVELTPEQASMIYSVLIRAKIDNETCIEEYKTFDGVTVFQDENKIIKEIISLINGEKR